MKYSLRSLMRFSLRDLFWITVVVAMGLAWWLDHCILTKSENKARVSEGTERGKRKYLQDILEKAEGYRITEGENGNLRMRIPAPNPPNSDP
jgi:hypothetical protein